MPTDRASTPDAAPRWRVLLVAGVLGVLAFEALAGRFTAFGAALAGVALATLTFGLLGYAAWLLSFRLVETESIAVRACAAGASGAGLLLGLFALLAGTGLFHAGTLVLLLLLLVASLRRSTAPAPR